MNFIIFQFFIMHFLTYVFTPNQIDLQDSIAEAMRDRKSVV